MAFRGFMAALVATVCAVTVAACGSSSSSDTGSASSSAAGGGSTSASTSGGTGGDQYATTLANLYKGEFTPPPSSGPAAQKGKKVWFISCGQIYEACADGATAFRAASKTLGWNTTIVDGKADPSVASAAIRQAVAAHVDGVGLVGFDCPAIKSALLDAKRAHIPVVQSFSFDCGDPGIPGPPLFAAGTTMKGLDLPHFRIAYGAARAAYTIAKTNGDAKIIDLAEGSQFTMKANNEGFVAAIQKCSTCKIVDTVNFTFADAPTGALQAKVLASLQKHPEANVLAVPADSLMPLGVQQGLRQSGRAGKIMVVGGEGFLPSLALIHQGVQTASLAYSYSWAAYGTADVLNRLFAGTTRAKLPDEGGGWQAIDSSHNLPPSGQKWAVPLDYAGAFDKIWSGGS